MKLILIGKQYPREWTLIPLRPDRDLKVGARFEGGLRHARKELATQTGRDERDVSLWIRGWAHIVEENGVLECKPQGQAPLEYKAQIEGVIERCFQINPTTADSYWTDCLPELEAVPKT